MVEQEQSGKWEVVEQEHSGKWGLQKEVRSRSVVASGGYRRR